MKHTKNIKSQHIQMILLLMFLYTIYIYILVANRENIHFHAKFNHFFFSFLLLWLPYLCLAACIHFMIYSVLDNNSYEAEKMF